jgi:hypothetical protein
LSPNCCANKPGQYIQLPQQAQGLLILVNSEITQVHIFGCFLYIVSTIKNGYFEIQRVVPVYASDPDDIW